MSMPRCSPASVRFHCPFGAGGGGTMLLSCAGNILSDESPTGNMLSCAEIATIPIGWWFLQSFKGPFCAGIKINVCSSVIFPLKNDPKTFMTYEICCNICLGARTSSNSSDNTNKMKHFTPRSLTVKQRMRGFFSPMVLSPTLPHLLKICSLYTHKKHLKGQQCRLKEAHMSTLQNVYLLC